MRGEALAETTITTVRRGVFEWIEHAVGDVLGEGHMIIMSHMTNRTLRRLQLLSDR